MGSWINGGAFVKVDIDNVLNNLVPRMFEFYEQQSGEHLDYADCTKYDFSCFNSKIYADLYGLFASKDMWDGCVPTKNSQRYLKKLCDTNNVIIVTATDICNFGWKCDWILKYFPFVNPKQIWRDDGEHRGLIWADFAVDDCVDNFQRETGYRILISAPWNLNYRCDDITSFRAKDMKEAYEIIERIKGKE